MEAVAIVFGLVFAALFLVGGVMVIAHLPKWLSGESAPVLDQAAVLQLLADVTAEAHAQGAEAQRAVEELRELAPQLSKEEWQLFEDRYRETLEVFSSGQSEVQAQLEHLDRIFRRDRVIGQARRELRED
ncbi:hypothetical protein M3B43_07075 [Nesterenkonia massiliensis]|uniref:Periplasmic heavy metal sensor n=1 Tax=Nesterenkonia massiliensis TaxID=1232429 RepID=A0ABT2HQX0_9MICC|nr:hypothetical protein [Nesterenkonia massiliensis]MCT1607090.1 hypothetical protein [Nesterenkonia massiliensis]